jgi:hypothetical protein
MKKWLLTPLIALVLSLSACVVTTDGDSTLTVINDSSYVIEEIYVAPVGTTTWGPDLLGNDVLYPDESLTIYLSYCDYYDVLIVDEYGLECVLDKLYLCYDDAAWVIDNFELATCGW